MIVKCQDGNYYQNPVWFNGTTIISAVGVEGVELWHKSKRPVKYRTLFTAANKLGLSIGVHFKDYGSEVVGLKDMEVDGDMTRMVFGSDKFCDAFHTHVNLSGCPTAPAKFDALLGSRPADGDDEIIEDFGIKAYKRRQSAKS